MSKEEEIKAKLTTDKSKERAVVDVAFLCDCTGSMGAYMEKAKETARQVLADTKETYSEASVFFAFVGYRDHCDKDLIAFQDLTGDVEEITKFIGGLTANGGGDEAEAVADALEYAAHKVSWRPDALRQIVHILDAPPHGKEFGGGDNHPEGCPCKRDYKKLLQELDTMQTEYLVLNFTPNVERMVAIFKQYHTRIQCVPLVIQPSVHPVPYGMMPGMAAYPGPASSKKTRGPTSRMKAEALAPSAMPMPMPVPMPMPMGMGMAMPKAKKAMYMASPPTMSGDLTTQVTSQMAKNISQSIQSNIARKYKK